RPLAFRAGKGRRSPEMGTVPAELCWRWLKDQLQGELDIALALWGGGFTKGSAGHLALGTSEMRGIGKVEELRPEFHVDSFGNREYLLHRKVVLGKAGAANNADAGIAERSDSRLPEGGLIEPGIAHTDLLRTFAVADAICTRAAGSGAGIVSALD